MTYQKTAALLSLVLTGCWPTLEPVAETTAEGAAELGDCQRASDCDAALDCVEGSCRLPCDLQYDCRDSSADHALCVAGHCRSAWTVACSAHDDCGATGWCYIVADDCAHGDPDSCDGGTAGTCMLGDARHCRQAALVTDCYASDQVCCEAIAGEAIGSHQCAVDSDCQPGLGGYQLLNPKALQ